MPEDNSRRGVVLVSGGMDSAVLIAHLANQGYELYAISFEYGQRSCYETVLARELCHTYGVLRHWVQRIDFPWGGSSLIDKSKDIPQRLPSSDEVHNTYVPGRNTIFLSFALSCAEVVGASKVFIGANELDYSNYPDCRKNYFDAYNNLVTQAVPRAVGFHSISIEAPFVNFSKSDIVVLGYSLCVDFSRTLSCYQAIDNVLACGCCSACLFRRRAFVVSGVPDTTLYA
ncbi:MULTISPECIES: 7-cyano-7-deazaguanine synthase QueC [Candidatus Ichthyocystis]|uniref:7-cyano-7-deazaguanine synthase n=1 Tax=Candidatus Ichthyocystis hellenicum TaxID=1561003 RepID=A0A0S4M8Q3_9BURK|nr:MULTISPECIES: 7-cyano-7-deazaguanine synthase QueC [Ichthyocystis]CUT17796.1 7-cyano-7-deazaguanine synthase [Candidatus Ichthyocystis hellenicum]